MFELVNWYGSSGITVFLVAFLESVGLAWIYGVDKFFDHVETMIGYRPSAFFKYCYLIVIPVTTAVSLTDMSFPTSKHPESVSSFGDISRKNFLLNLIVRPHLTHQMSAIFRHSLSLHVSVMNRCLSVTTYIRHGQWQQGGLCCCQWLCPYQL